MSLHTSKFRTPMACCGEGLEEERCDKAERCYWCDEPLVEGSGDQFDRCPPCCRFCLEMD